MKVLLLGGAGYVARRFAEVLFERGHVAHVLSRGFRDYTSREVLLEVLGDVRPDVLVSAAGYTGFPNVDACEPGGFGPGQCILGNQYLTETVALCARREGVPWLQVGSGCIYRGCKVDGVVVKDMMEDWVQDRVEGRRGVEGFTEEEEPNFTFDHPPCSFYSGCKALGERMALAIGGGYVARLRIPFDWEDHPKNYLTKLVEYPKLYQNWNSLSDLTDFVVACVELLERKAPYGAYNVVNTGYVSTQEVVNMLGLKHVQWFRDDTEFYEAVKAPRSNCILSNSKLQSVGIQMPTVESSIYRALRGKRG